MGPVPLLSDKQAFQIQSMRCILSILSISSGISRVYITVLDANLAYKFTAASAFPHDKRHQRASYRLGLLRWLSSLSESADENVGAGHEKEDTIMTLCTPLAQQEKWGGGFQKNLWGQRDTHVRALQIGISSLWDGSHFVSSNLVYSQILSFDGFIS